MGARRSVGLRSWVACAATLTFGCGSLLAPKPAWELPVPPPDDRSVVDPAAITRLDLDNGLRVLIN